MTYTSEDEARGNRRVLIGWGIAVSLMTYDADRNLFVFDIV